MAEQFTNDAQTTLSSGINDSVTSLTVVSTTGFPTVGTFRILIKAEGANTDEICTVTSVAGSVYTITRASEAKAGVQAASAHGAGAGIVHVLTSGGLKSASLFFHGAKAYATATTTYVTTVFKATALGAELYDTDAYHDNSTNNSRMTIPTGLAGYYLCIGQATWDSNTTGERILEIAVGGGYGGGTHGWSRDNIVNSNGMARTVQGIVLLSAGQYVELACYQSSGSDRTTTGDSRSSLSVAFLGI